jgi:FixJ family two-component response regulator
MRDWPREAAPACPAHLFDVHPRSNTNADPTDVRYGQMPPKVRRVAVVDDDPFVLRGLERLLRSAGYEVDAYASGISFLAAITDREPDCVVLDLHMPKTSGFAVQAYLSQCENNVPVVVITGDLTPEARVRALSLGAKSYLCKPVDTEVLLPAIEAALSSAMR